MIKRVYAFPSFRVSEFISISHLPLSLRRDRKGHRKPKPTPTRRTQGRQALRHWAGPETTKPVAMDGLLKDLGGLGRNRTTDTRIFKTTHTASCAPTKAKECNAFFGPLPPGPPSSPNLQPNPAGLSARIAIRFFYGDQPDSAAARRTRPIRPHGQRLRSARADGLPALGRRPIALLCHLGNSDT